MRGVMVRMQGNEKVAAIVSLKLNFKEGSQANRIALSMMKRIMQRIQNIQRIRVIRAWREQCQKEATMHNARTDTPLPECLVRCKALGCDAYPRSSSQALIKKLDAGNVVSLMDELRKAKEEGSMGMMRLIMKKMQLAIKSRSVLNWKKNHSMTVLEGKIDGGGVAFLEDAKRKERERQQEDAML